MKRKGGKNTTKNIKNNSCYVNNTTTINGRPWGVLLNKIDVDLLERLRNALAQLVYCSSRLKALMQISFVYSEKQTKSTNKIERRNCLLLNA
jgi:hypothetical protein